MKFLQKIYLIVSAIIFLISRLINLTLIPIFNDEAIYINWGQIMINTPDKYLSLLDGKQPLLMWLFGMSNKFIENPLIAGRIVSVIFSFTTVYALFLIGKKYLKFPYFYFPAIIYLITPLFLFFDRQALMESSLTAINVWAFYLTQKHNEKPSLINIGILGVILGLGLFIKSTALIFLISTLFLLIVNAYKNRSQKNKINPIFSILIIIFIVFVILIPLFSEPQFNLIISRGDRYNLTLKELLSFPLNVWWTNIKSIIEISFWHLTPIIFILGCIGIYIAVIKKNSSLLLWFFISLIIAIVTARGLSPRYLVSFLPFFALFSSFTINEFKGKKPIFMFFIVCLIIPITVNFLLLTNSVSYFNLMDTVSKNYSQKNEYVTGDTSGYALSEVIKYLEDKAKTGPFVVGVRLDAGNPENAILAYFYNNQTIKATYLDVKMFPDNFDFSKIELKNPVYFVSRSQHQGGLEKHLVEEKRFYKPEGKSYFSVLRFDPKK